MLIAYQHDVLTHVNGSKVSNFRLFKQYITEHIKDIMDGGDLSEVSKGYGEVKYIISREAVHHKEMKDFKKYKFIGQQLYCNEFKIDEYNHGFQLLSRKHDNIVWNHCGKEVIRCRKIKQVVNKILCAFTTRNLSKLICYSV